MYFLLRFCLNPQYFFYKENLGYHNIIEILSFATIFSEIFHVLFAEIIKMNFLNLLLFINPLTTGAHLW